MAAGLPEKLVECANLEPLRSRFNPISLCVGFGEWLCISGPSGAGKTSLLFALAGLQKPVSGKIRCMGSDLTDLSTGALRRLRRHSIHLVPQSLLLCSQLDALHNVLLAQRLQGRVQPEECRDILIKLGMRTRLNFLPSHLSIGERQRVCIARGLSTNVPLLLMDEPTSNLDGESVIELVELFKEALKAGRSLVVVSNDSRLTHLADRIIHVAFAPDDRENGNPTPVS